MKRTTISPRDFPPYSRMCLVTFLLKNDHMVHPQGIWLHSALLVVSYFFGIICILYLKLGFGENQVPVACLWDSWRENHPLPFSHNCESASWSYLSSLAARVSHSHFYLAPTICQYRYGFLTSLSISSEES